MRLEHRLTPSRIVAAALAVAGISGGLFVTSCVELAKKIGLAECAPAYGNWCGENYPLTGFDPEAVDDWDEACRDHDQCYDDHPDGDRDGCDREFRRELVHLSRSEMVPQALINAHDWFTDDGHFQGFQSLSSAIWAATASCEGGDGRAAEFSCQTQAGPCALSSYWRGGGSQGMPCHCGGWPGVVMEN